LFEFLLQVVDPEGYVVQSFPCGIWRIVFGTFRIPVELQLHPRPPITKKYKDTRTELRVVSSVHLFQTEEFLVELGRPLKVGNPYSDIAEVYEDRRFPVSINGCVPPLNDED
jgi:hypothetical protein